jgi:hypothetical protein
MLSGSLEHPAPESRPFHYSMVRAGRQNGDYD